MSEKNILQLAAARASHDQLFLGHDLQYYLEMAEVTVERLAELLLCSSESLTRLSLCFRPDPSSELFPTEVKQVALHCGANPQRLAALLREVDAVRAMRKATELQVMAGPRSSGALLMAARDHTKKKKRSPLPSKKQKHK